jgi:hypothetical protein
LVPLREAIPSNCGRPFAFNEIGLILSRPRWHSRTNCHKGFEAVASKLKMGSCRHCDRYPGTNIDRFLVVAQSTPHATMSGYEIPDLLNRVMRNSFRYGLWRQCEYSHSAPIQSTQQTNFGAIRCDRIRRAINALSFKVHKLSSLIYLVHLRTRKSRGDMMRKLSVTLSHSVLHLLGTSRRRKPSTASQNPL